MMRATTLIAILLLVALEPATATADDVPTPAARQYEALVKQYEQEGNARALAGRFLELAEQHPNDPAAVDALLWVVQNVRGRPDTTRALELLKSRHIDSKKLATACESIASSRSTAAEDLLRTAFEKSADAAVRAQACYHLALLFDREASVVEQLKAAPELAPRVLQYYGNDYGKHLASLSLEKLAKQRQQVYEAMRTSFADVKIQDDTLGQIAEKALFAIRHLSVGSIAAEIEGEDVFQKRFKLSDYRGKVVMLTFWGHW